MSNDFIEEIKEDVRNDQLIALWHEYGNFIIGLIIAIILSTIGYLYWHDQQEKKLLKQTLAYENNLSLDASKGEKADYTSLINDGSKGYKILGTFEQARIALTEKESENALKSLASDTSIDSFYRQLAELQIIMKKFDSTNGKVLLEELQGLIDKKSFIQAAAIELNGFAHLKLNNRKKATQDFMSVAQHPQAPQSMKIRARAMLEMLN